MVPVGFLFDTELIIGPTEVLEQHHPGGMVLFCVNSYFLLPVIFDRRNFAINHHEKRLMGVLLYVTILRCCMHPTR